MTEDTRTLDEILKTLSPEQLVFVEKRMYCRWDNEAAQAAGIPPKTMYNWDNKSDINRAVQLARMDGVKIARERLRRLLGSAVGVLEDEMGRGKKQRLAAALEVLDRTGVVTVTRTELSGPDGGPIETKETGNYGPEEYARGLATLYETIRSGGGVSDGGGRDAVDAAEHAPVVGDPQSSG